MHKGAIAVPCQPQQLQNIIDGQRWDEQRAVN
jgi:hypothetical protein